ncbi:MAG: TPM domain-containing protein [Pseudomonadota bacterium]
MLIRRTDCRRLAALFAVLVLLLPAGLALGAASYPELIGRVVDQAGLLDSEQKASLARQLGQYESQTTNQVVVVTLTSLHGEEIADYGRRLGNRWGIGQSGRNNGVLLIVAPHEREVRIAVGRGLERQLTDKLAQSIISAEILPTFKRGDFSRGIIQGTDGILAALSGTYAPSDTSSGGPLSKLTPVFVGLIMLVVVFAIFFRRHSGGGEDGWWDSDRHHRRSRRGRSRSGRFGGGGASGKW